MKKDKKANYGDSIEVEGLLHDFKIFSSHRQSTGWEKRATQGYGFYFGDGQWDADTKQRLIAKHRPVSVFNVVLPAVDTIIGPQIGNRVDLVPTPVDNASDVYTADILANAIKFVEQTNNIVYERRPQFFDGLATGLGIKEFSFDTTHSITGKILCRQQSPWHFFLDPTFQRYDYTDAKKLFRVKWLTKKDAVSVYGKDKIKDIVFPTEETIESYPIAMARPTWAENPSNYGRIEGLVFEGIAEDLGYDVKGNRLRVVEQYEKLEKDVKYYWDFDSSDFLEYDTLSDMEKTFIDDTQTITIKKSYIRLTTVIGSKVVEQADLKAEEFYHLFNFYFPYFANGKYMGVIDNLIYPQMEVNKRHSTVTDFLSRLGAGGIYYERGAFTQDDEASIQDKLAQNNLAIQVDEFYNDKGNPKIIERKFPEIPTIYERLMASDEYRVKHIANVEDPMQGIHQGKQSGVAKRAEIEQSAIRLQGIIDNFRRTQYLEGKAMLFWIQNYLTDETVVRIMGEKLGQGNYETVLNHEHNGIKWNDVSVGEYDIRLVYEGKTETERERLQYKVLEMGRNDPANADIYNEIILRNSDFPEKEEVLQKLEQKRQMAQQMAQMQNAPNRGGITSAPRPSRGVKRIPQQMQ